MRAWGRAAFVCYAANVTIPHSRAAGRAARRWTNGLMNRLLLRAVWRSFYPGTELKSLPTPSASLRW